MLLSIEANRLSLTVYGIPQVWAEKYGNLEKLTPRYVCLLPVESDGMIVRYVVGIGQDGGGL